MESCRLCQPNLVLSLFVDRPLHTMGTGSFLVALVNACQHSLHSSWMLSVQVCRPAIFLGILVCRAFRIEGEFSIRIDKRKARSTKCVSSQLFSFGAMNRRGFAPRNPQTRTVVRCRGILKQLHEWCVATVFRPCVLPSKVELIFKEYNLSQDFRIQTKVMPLKLGNCSSITLLLNSSH